MTITTTSHAQIIITTPTQTKHKYKACNNNDEVNEITHSTHTSKRHLQNMKIAKNTMTQTPLIAYLTPPQTQNDYQGKMKLSKSN